MEATVIQTGIKQHNLVVSVIVPGSNVQMQSSVKGFFVC